MERIIKIAKNNVEIQTYYYDGSDKDEEIIIKKESFGIDRVEIEKKKSQKEFDNYNIKSKRDIKKAEIQSRLDTLNIIEQKLGEDE